MPRNNRRTINFYPPFLGAGIKVRRISADWREVDVEMKLHWWNKNYVGTHFGGSLYAMADPWYMVMLMNILGREYIVWDKAATIRFKRPGKGTVRAEFRLSEAQIEDVRAKVEAQKKYEPTFVVEVTDAAGEVVAEVEKVLYVRKKDDRD